MYLTHLSLGTHPRVHYTCARAQMKTFQFAPWIIRFINRNFRSSSSSFFSETPKTNESKFPRIIVVYAHTCTHAPQRKVKCIPRSCTHSHIRERRRRRQMGPRCTRTSDRLPIYARKLSRVMHQRPQQQPPPPTCMRGT